MEAGFHAFLGKYVLHTHSVYVVTLSGSIRGREVLSGACARLKLRAVHVPYCNPGTDLAVAVGKIVERAGAVPDVLFLQNHGLIVSASTANRTLAIHRAVHAEILKRVQFRPYTTPRVVPSGARWKSGTVRGRTVSQFSKKILFPDQVVFCDVFSKKKTAAITVRNGVVHYALGHDAAFAAEEIINAWDYVVRASSQLSFPVRQLPPAVRRYVSGMAAEKHRRGMVK